MTSATSPKDLSFRCRECHALEYEEWVGSQHAHAQRPLGPRDFEAFSSSRIPEGETLFPDHSGGQQGFRDRTSGQFYRAVAAIGIEPLQQYLLEMPEGRYQIAPLSWDPHKKEWFDAQEPKRTPDDWSFWSHRGMNWNSQCAYCHMTDLQKNYDLATDAYATTWTTMGISCTQCHGDMSAHLANPQSPVGIKALSPEQVLSNCASCHSRREELTGSFQPGELFDNHYRLATADQPGIYYADGQVRDEDFEYGSLLMSRMGHKGVQCLDCHSPHSAKLRLPVENNSLCMSCHSPPTQRGATPINSSEHTFHAAGTPGSRCVDCHMAHTTYMGRDPRRDHGFTSPDPRLTVEAGIPNSCNRCHNDQSPEWAEEWVNRWYGAERMETRRSRQRARVILRAQSGDPALDPALLEMASSEEIPLWRAALVALLAPWNDDPTVQERLQGWLADPSPPVRAAAIRALFAGRFRQNVPGHLFQDPFRIVRIEAGWQSAIRRSPPSNMEEIRKYLANQSDQPSGALRQAQLALARNENPAALAWARKAADWDRSSSGAWEMLAMVGYEVGDTGTARMAFEQALSLDPENAGLWYSLALLLAELRDSPGAVNALEKCVAADPGFARAWYNLGLAYSQVGRDADAEKALQKAGDLLPSSPDAFYALATILARKGEKERAREQLQKALRVAPNHRPASQLLEALGKNLE